MILKSGPICGSMEESLPKKAESPLGVRIDKDHIQLQEMGNLKKKKYLKQIRSFIFLIYVPSGEAFQENHNQMSLIPLSFPGDLKRAAATPATA